MLGSLLPVSRLLLVTAVLLSTAAIPAAARLGETVANLKERFGRSPERESPKNMAVWFVESVDGVLVYTATLNAKGFIIAEGIKPLKRAVLTTEIVKDFLQDQIKPHADSKTSRIVPAGEKYEFAKQSFVCAKDEWVLVDEPNGLLLVWSRAGISSVMAISPEMLLPKS